MTRPTDLLLGPKAYGRGRAAPMMNLKNGGQFGYTPDYSTLVSSQPYVRGHVIAKLLSAPRGFDLLPEPDYWKETLKALIELHPESWEGLNSTLTVEHASAGFGGAGEEIEEESDFKRERSNPSAKYTEKRGKSIQTFWEGYIQMLMGTPETKYPLVMTLPRGREYDGMIDSKSFTTLYFEPDRTGTRVVDAWLCAGMRPKGAGTREGSRDLRSGMQLNEFNVEFTSITQVGYGVLNLAQQIMDQMNMTGASPLARPAYLDKVQPNVSTLTGTGYTEQLAQVARTSVQV